METAPGPPRQDPRNAHVTAHGAGFQRPAPVPMVRLTEAEVRCPPYTTGDLALGQGPFAVVTSAEVATVAEFAATGDYAQSPGTRLASHCLYLARMTDELAH